MLLNILRQRVVQPQRPAVLGWPVLSWMLQLKLTGLPRSTAAAPSNADCKRKVGIRVEQSEKGRKETLRPECRERRGPHHWLLAVSRLVESQSISSLQKSCEFQNCLEMQISGAPRELCASKRGNATLDRQTESKQPMC